MKNTGDGRRVARIEKEVQQTVASFLLSGFKTRLPGLVTVSYVKMPADLRTAKVYVSVMLSERDLESGDISSEDDVIDLLQEHAGEVQRYLGDELKLRYCPKLTFYKDESTHKILKIEKIIRDIHQDKIATRDGSDDEVQDD